MLALPTDLLKMDWARDLFNHELDVSTVATSYRSSLELNENVNKSQYTSIFLDYEVFWFEIFTKILTGFLKLLLRFT